MVKRKPQFPPSRGDEQTTCTSEMSDSDDTQGEDYHTGPSETDIAITSELSDTEHDTTVIPDPREVHILPSYSGTKTRELAPKAPRRSARLLKKRQTDRHSEAEIPISEPSVESKGDSTGIYGFLKGAFQDMTSQLVNAIQTAFKGNAVPVTPEPKMSRQKMKPETMRKKSIPPSPPQESSDTELTDLSSDNSDSDVESVSTCRVTKSKSRDYSHNVKLPSYTGKEKWEVWYSRFEAVAELKGWISHEKLQEILPCRVKQVISIA